MSTRRERDHRPRLYFNLRSPYSWLALHDLTTRHGDLVDVVEWRPAWEPDSRSEALLAAAGGRVVYTPMSREKHLYVLADVRRLAEERGLGVVWPVDEDPHWDVPHLAYLVAEAAGRGVDFAVAVSRARWERGLDISRLPVVADIGASLGLDPDALADAYADPEVVALGTRKLMDMYHDRVFGMPYFIHGHQRFWGVDRLDAFVGSVRAAPPAPEPDPLPVDIARATTDDGHAGGCG